VAVIATTHGRGPLKVLLAPVLATFDVFLGVVSGDVGRCLLVATRGCLPASLGRAKHDHLIAGGVLGGDAARLFKRSPEEVAMSALPWALHTALG
jgi:hypothetical protein